MVMELYISEIAAPRNCNRDKLSVKCKPFQDMVDKAEDNASDSMDCSICLELVQDPVVTFCGHLYCWPCIYKWIRFQSEPTEDSDQKQPQCPVCKAEISEETVIPLYGKGLSTPSKGKAPQLGLDIPQRPQSPRSDGQRMVSTPTGIVSRVPQLSNLSRVQQPQQYQDYSSPRSYVASPALRVGGGDASAANLGHPGMGMYGEMVFARIFGNSQATLYAYPNSYNLAGTNNPRIRRHVMESDKSLTRLTFFLMCCMILCLILF